MDVQAVVEGIEIPEEVLDEFLAGRCMDLAAAIHRKHGWEIQVQLEPFDFGGAGGTLTVDELVARLGADKSKWPYIAHAWCVHPKTGYCYDIDGGFPSPDFHWTASMKGLDEEALRRLVDVSAGRTVLRGQWDEGVASAAVIMDLYQADTVSPPTGRRPPDDKPTLGL